MLVFTIALKQKTNDVVFLETSHLTLGKKGYEKLNL